MWNGIVQFFLNMYFHFFLFKRGNISVSYIKKYKHISIDFCQFCTNLSNQRTFVIVSEHIEREIENLVLISNFVQISDISLTLKKHNWVEND